MVPNSKKCAYCGRECSCPRTKIIVVGSESTATGHTTLNDSTYDEGMFWVTSTGYVDDMEDLLTTVPQNGFRVRREGVRNKQGNVQNEKGFQRWVCKGARI